MSIVIQEMTTQDCDEVLALWRTSEGVGLSDADSEEGVARFLDRNPGLSFVARDGEHLVGAVLCGHDGRRGYIHHRSAEPFVPLRTGLTTKPGCEQVSSLPRAWPGAGWALPVRPQTSGDWQVSYLRLR